MVAHACNPSTLEAKVGGSPEVGSSRPAWPTWWNPTSTTNRKISRAWWQAPEIPSPREVEAGESLEPGRVRLQWAERTTALQRGRQRETLSPKKTYHFSLCASYLHCVTKSQIILRFRLLLFVVCNFPGENHWEECEVSVLWTWKQKLSRQDIYIWTFTFYL